MRNLPLVLVLLLAALLAACGGATTPASTPTPDLSTFPNTTFLYRDEGAVANGTADGVILRLTFSDIGMPVVQYRLSDQFEDWKMALIGLEVAVGSTFEVAVSETDTTHTFQITSYSELAGQATVRLLTAETQE